MPVKNIGVGYHHCIWGMMYIKKLRVYDTHPKASILPYIVVTLHGCLMVLVKTSVDARLFFFWRKVDARLLSSQDFFYLECWIWIRQIILRWRHKRDKYTHFSLYINYVLAWTICVTFWKLCCVMYCLDLKLRIWCIGPSWMFPI